MQQPTCPVHGTPDAPYSTPGTDVVIAWSVSGAKGAAIAVDNPGIYGAYGSDYPASGKLTLSFGCDGQGTTTPHLHGLARGRARRVAHDHRLRALRRLTPRAAASGRPDW